jgi:signal peptidase
MEPAINTGDVVVVKPQPQYHQRETITFYDADHRVVTHRIVKIDNQDSQSVFTTKGDANENVDSQVVPEDQVIGKLVMVLPKIGFAVSFAKTRYGALLLIIVPAVIIIYDEFRKMKG